jgi:hypothetical protein
VGGLFLEEYWQQKPNNKVVLFQWSVKKSRLKATILCALNRDFNIIRIDPDSMLY